MIKGVHTAIENINSIDFSRINGIILKFDGILGSIDNKQGTFGMLLHDDALYQNLNNSLQSIDKLVNNLREHPKRYVHFSLFGRRGKR